MRKTTDIALAAFLTMRGLEVKVDRQDSQRGSRGIFSFVDTEENDKKIDSLAKEFYHSEFHFFHTTLRGLKSRLEMLKEVKKDD